METDTKILPSKKDERKPNFYPMTIDEIVQEAAAKAGVPVKTVLTVTCAWCGCDMGTKEGEGVSGVSHGICESCYEKMTPAKPDDKPFNWREHFDVRAD